jgi:multidrug efflux system membrane fusion protein
MRLAPFPVLAVLAILSGCQTNQTHEKPLTPVKASPAELMSTASESRYSANISPETQVNVAFRMGGYVASLRSTGGREIQEGDVVNRGDVLATLRQSDFVTKVKEAEAHLAQARAGLEAARSQSAEAAAASQKAQLDFGRARNLFASQSLTKNDYDAAQANADVSQARVAAAQAQTQSIQAQIDGVEQMVQEARIALEDSELKAPLGGVVLKKAIQAGSLAGPGTLAFVLADTRSVKATFGVPDTLVASLHTGAALGVTTEAVPNTVFPGQVTDVSPAADPKSRVFDVEVTIPNQAGHLKAGMIATVTVKEAGNRADVLAIPLTAVVRSPRNPDRYAVFVLAGPESRFAAQIREVRLGATFGNSIVVMEGLKKGERVITAGANIVADGEAVQLIP